MTPTRPDWLNRSYEGDAATQAFCRSIGQTRVLEVLRSIRATSFRIHLGLGGEAFFAEIMEGFSALQPGTSSKEMTAFVRRSRAKARQLGLLSGYSTYKACSLRRTVSIAQLSSLSGVVVDIGAGNNVLGKLLVEPTNAVRLVIGVDVRAGEVVTIPGQLTFRRQETIDQIPLPSGVVDAAIMRYALHHMELGIQEKILLEAHRILRPGGRLIIIEDTYSDQITPLAGNALLDEFDSLSPLERIMALACLDASSCFLLKESMSFCFSFRTMEEWVTALEHAGFSVLSTEYWGLPFFSLFQAPLGILHLKRESGASTRKWSG